jgi:hypothetical protein
MRETNCRPRISVIIPTHNRPHLLPRAVSSARAAGTEVEIIVVDDASVDRTAEVCGRLEGIKYIRVERNRGVAGARNLGLLASAADYVSFLDDDDVRLPGSLDVQLAALAAAPDAGMVYGQMFPGDRDCAATGEAHPTHCPQGDVFWNLLELNFIPCGAVVFRKSCLTRVGLLDESIAGVDDWDLWIRIAELYGVRALLQPVIIWRQSGFESGQLSSQTARMITLSAHLLRSKWLALPRAAAATARQREAIWHRYRTGGTHYLLWQTAQAFQQGCYRQACRNIFAALRFNPAEVARSIFHPATLNFCASALSHK